MQERLKSRFEENDRSCPGRKKCRHASDRDLWAKSLLSYHLMILRRQTCSSSVLIILRLLKRTCGKVHDICHPVFDHINSIGQGRMSRASSEDQLNFLLSCVKHACNGKVSPNIVCPPSTRADDGQVDFVEVAQECGVVSKGAA